MQDPSAPCNGTDPQAQRYLIGSAAGGSLRDLSQTLLSDPRLKVRRVMGPQDNPVMVIAEMTPELAEQLQAQFAGRLIIEPDAEVFPADDQPN